jgi:aryl-alcohol dehydrogenase-like predicted oxidoreductase
MVKKLISRKRFILSAVTGIAGISLIDNSLNSMEIPSPKLRDIGRTGIKVTPVCFGAPRTNEESLIQYVIDKGINFIDTGRAYGNGNNERLVGRAVSGKRANIIIQSKIRLESNELPSKGKGKKGAEEIRHALQSKLEASLKAIGSDYIDILLYHDAIDENLLYHSETMKFFSDSKSAGMIKASGFSAHNDYLNLHTRNNTENFYDIMMVPFNHKGSFVHSVTGRYSEWDQEKLIIILEEAYKKGTGIVAMKTCSGGKYSPSPDVIPGYSEAVKWVLQKEYITAAAIAMASFEEVDEHLSLLNISRG